MGGSPPPPLSRSWALLHPSQGIWRMRSSRLQCYVGSFAPLLHSLGFRHLRSVSLLLRLSSQVLRIQKTTLHTLVHLGDSPSGSFRHSSRQGSDTPPQTLPPIDFTSSRLQVWWMSRLNGPPISPGLNICEPPAIRPRRSLNLGSWRADRYPRFCPRSRGPRRCLTRLTKGRLSRLTPRSTTSWVPSHRSPGLSHCQ